MTKIVFSRVETASSFSFNLSEKLALNCALFVNESTVKWSDQRTEFLLKWSGSLLKKLIKLSLSIGFCVDVHLALLSFAYYMCESVCGAKTGSDVESVGGAKQAAM